MLLTLLLIGKTSGTVKMSPKKWVWQKEKIDPPEWATKKEVQEMIDDAIRKHNRNAGIISMCVGWVVLALFAEGLLRLIGVIPPLLSSLKIVI
jgi:hypothetical protein